MCISFQQFVWYCCYISMSLIDLLFKIKQWWWYTDTYRKNFKAIFLEGNCKVILPPVFLAYPWTETKLRPWLPAPVNFSIHTMYTIDQLTERVSPWFAVGQPNLLIILKLSHWLDLFPCAVKYLPWHCPNRRILWRIGERRDIVALIQQLKQCETHTHIDEYTSLYSMQDSL